MEKLITERWPQPRSLNSQFLDAVLVHLHDVFCRTAHQLGHKIANTLEDVPEQTNKQTKQKEKREHEIIVFSRSEIIIMIAAGMTLREMCSQRIAR